MAPKKRKRPPNPTPGFTLIELLTVVAIVLILVAIALPSFLESLVRSKVTRALSELRSLEVAVQSYVNDYSEYPTSADEMGRPIQPYPPQGLGPEVFETRLSSALTTPVVYIAAIPFDPFASDRSDPDDPRAFEGPTYHYGSLAYASANDGPPGAAKFEEFARMLGGSTESVKFYVASHGPDYDHDDDENPADRHAAAPYNPTNGGGSSGDIVLLGPGHGFAQ